MYRGDWIIELEVWLSMYRGDWIIELEVWLSMYRGDWIIERGVNGTFVSFFLLPSLYLFSLDFQRFFFQTKFTMVKLVVTQKPILAIIFRGGRTEENC